MNQLPYDPRYERLINHYLEHDYGASEEFFSPQEINSFRTLAIEAYREEEFRLAGIGNRFQVLKEKTIRSDKILWLDKKSVDPILLNFFKQIDEYVSYLNISCYAGIRSYEFHYAIYEKGSFYRRHSDQFRNSDQRTFSMVLYLTEDWRKGDGGELVIYKEIDGVEERVLIEPKAGKLIFFNSSLEHEVLESHERRISLTGWLRTT